MSGELETATEAETSDEDLAPATVGKEHSLEAEPESESETEPESEPEPEDEAGAEVVPIFRDRPRSKPETSEDLEAPSAQIPEPAQPPEPAVERAEEEASGGGGGLGWVILGVAAVLALGLWFSRKPEQVDPAAEGEASGGVEPSASKHDEGPRARPPHRSHTAPGDPRLAAMIEAREAETGTDTGPGETGSAPGDRPPPVDLHPRDPRVIPRDTPDANAKAFSKLPVSIHDRPPIGAIGKSGLHIDDVDVGRDYNSGCVGSTRRFSVASDDFANVCFRAVHPREDESVWVYWEKEGVVTRRGKVHIRDIHAYKTRAYLKLRPEYLGSWRVRISPEDEEDTDLAVVAFEIVE